MKAHPGLWCVVLLLGVGLHLWVDSAMAIGAVIGADGMSEPPMVGTAAKLGARGSQGLVSATWSPRDRQD